MNNSSTTMYVNSIGGAVGEANIASTRRTHFWVLYNSVPVDEAQAKFYEKVKMCTENSSDINIWGRWKCRSGKSRSRQHGRKMQER